MASIGKAMKDTVVLCQKIDRRKFIRGSALLGGSALLVSHIDRAFNLMGRAEAGYLTPTEEFELSKAENVINSVCLQCHTSCPIKGKLLNGVLVKIDGNPYGSQTLMPQIPYASPISQAALVDAKLCPKGQAGIQSLYDPYRIRKVLKRAGKRGENRWVSIPFDQAIDEIVNGGVLFKNVAGEETRQVPGLKSLYVLHDTAVAKAMAKDAAEVIKKKMTVKDFQAKHRNNLDLLIDRNHPDLGPKNNQFVFEAGRIEHGRKEFAKRWLKGGFGSSNWYEHTTICEQSHHIAYNEITNQYQDGKWDGGKTHMKPDALYSEFILFIGTGAFEANFGPTNMAEKVTEGLVSGRLKIAVADPRCSKTAAKAWKWLPVKPGTDAAMALGMTRWILENHRYDKSYLQNANKAAAKKGSELTWTNATWLVHVDDKGVPGKFLRAEELGLGKGDRFVAQSEGRMVAVDPHDDAAPVTGDLFVEGQANGIRYKSAFQLLKEQAFARPLDGWATDCGLKTREIVEVARELTSHGKRAAVELYRGPVQHTNGYYNAQAIIALNILIGNSGHKGGLTSGGGHWHEDGSKEGQPFNLGKGLHPGALKAFGITLTKEGHAYEDSTLFTGYPAKRPWYPFTDNVYQEIIPAAEDGYPYPIQALFLHKGTPGFATPAGHLALKYLIDPKKLPLFIACDVVIAETSMYADYLFPDLSIWERWGTPHTTPDVNTISSKVRQPMVAPLTEVVKVFDQSMPISMEAVMLAIAERLRLPGFGKGGFAPDQDFLKPEDFYLRLVANIAAGDKAGDSVPEASDEEIKTFLQARRHLPTSVFDPQRWETILGSSLWRRVVYVLNRGGRYEDFEKAYKGDALAHAFKGHYNIYVENVAVAKDSMTGQNFSGMPIFDPVREASGAVVNDADYSFHLITFKEVFGGQSRTPGNYWVTASLPENFVIMSALDAATLQLGRGDRVKLISATNPDGMWDLLNGQKIPVMGKVLPIQGLRPGVVAVSWHYGHWAYGAGDVEIDGQPIKGDPRRATGLCTNAVLRVDTGLKNVCLSDPIGGSSSFYDTKVNVVRV